MIRGRFSGALRPSRSATAQPLIAMSGESVSNRSRSSGTILASSLDAVASLPGATRAWSGDQPFVRYLDDFTEQKGRWIQSEHPMPIYAMRWSNPEPEKPVESVAVELLQSGVLAIYQIRAEP